MIDYTIFGGDNIDQGSRTQMDNACDLPIARRAALMPDAHQGYGMPIGGVLATKNAVIPYGVGMDIACRMRITFTETSRDALRALTINLEEGNEHLDAALRTQTKFGMGCAYQRSGRQTHPVMFDERWSDVPMLQELKATAWNQLGTSGGGNHFVEWGIADLREQVGNVLPGTYIALMSHSGSRGTGAKVCQHYTKIAKEQNPAGELSWLDMDSEAGQEYWMAMNLMGDYAAANHEIIHRKVLAEAGLDSVGHVENHHNFAWKEVYRGEEQIVHRKGATPAGLYERGVIPGSMATPAYIVEGKGYPLSINSASHGAGRAMSRKAAKAKFTWAEWAKYLEAKRVRVLAAGIDEVPGAYKDIEKVMEAQREMVDVLGVFDPKIVMMAAGKGGRR
jgi:tRNA-splicing ligase RtcB